MKKSFRLDFMTKELNKLHNVFSKKISVLKIFVILFEQDCPEAVVHGCMYNQKYLNTTYLCNTIVFLHLGQFWQLLSFFGVKKEGLRQDILSLGIRVTFIYPSAELT